MRPHGHFEHLETISKLDIKKQSADVQDTTVP